MTAETTTPSETTLYWHSLPVVCLNFTTEGSFLLTGGHECVLFKWMYKKNQTLSTFYLAEIEYFSRLNCFIGNGCPGHLQFYSCVQINYSLM
jgi:hypothetical protein